MDGLLKKAFIDKTQDSRGGLRAGTPSASVVVQFQYLFKIVIPKRSSIARGICYFVGKSRFLADKTGSE
jgi:hypothetical protein